MVLVGESGSGKSSVLAARAGRSFDDVQKTNIAISESVTVNGVTMNVWDTSGSHGFRCLVPMYARLANLAVIVIDLNKKSAVKKIEDWINFLNEKVAVYNVIIAVNKIDEGKSQERSAIEAFCFENQLKMVLVSAKTGKGIEELFSEISDEIGNKSQIATKIEDGLSPIQKTEEKKHHDKRHHKKLQKKRFVA